MLLRALCAQQPVSPWLLYVFCFACLPVPLHPHYCVQAAATAGGVGAVRHLNLHEYQSKDLMEKYGVQVQKGKMADSAEKAHELAQWIKKDSA